MTYRNLFFSLLVGIFCCIPSPVHAGMMPNMNNMNMDDFEKELAEANRAIEEYVASLPPAEQEAFNKQVEEMSRMFENMSEDEFEQFLGEMFADEPMMMEPNPFDAIQDTPQEEVVEVVLSTDDKKKVETAIAILDDIIKQSNMFMVIVNSSSELPERINLWAQKSEIPHWQPEADWMSLKAEIELFIQKLYRAEEQDLTTKKYKYLFELIADEALYNNLIQLRTELKNIIPTIEIPEFGVQKLNSESKTALKNVLGKYTESFYLLDIPKALDTLFEKYAPEEEKIKAAEEAATKRAQESSRMARTPASKTEAGSEAMGYGYDDYYGGGYDNYYGSDYGGYGNDYGYSPNYGSYGGQDYGFGGGSGSSRSGGGSSDGGGSSGGSAGIAKDKEESEKDKDKDKKDKKDKFTPNFELDTAINNIKKDFEDIKAAMTETEDNPTKLADLKNFAAHITNNDEKIDETLVSYILPRVIDKKIDNIATALKKIDKKELNADDLTHYQKEIKKIFDEHTKQLKPFIDMVHAFETEQEKAEREAEPHLHPIATDDEAKKINVSTLPAAKQWAYFGVPADKLELAENETKLSETITPVSLFEISKKIETLLDEVKKFGTKVAKAPKKPAAKEMDWSDILTMPAPPVFE